MKKLKTISIAGIATIALAAGPVLADQQPLEDRSLASPAIVHGRVMEPAWADLRLSSDFIGQDLKTADGEETIGSISDAFVDFGSGSVPGVVVGTGGFLGIGERDSLVSLDALEPIADSDDFRASFTKEQVESAPEVEDDRELDFVTVRPLGTRATDAETHAVLGRVVLFSDLTGMDIMNREDEKIGSVDEVYFDLANQQVIGVVVSTGGFLGLGDHKTLLSFRELQYDGSEEVIRVNLTKTDLEEAPEFDRDEPNLGERLGDRWEAFRANMDTEYSVFDQGMGRSDIATTAAIRRELREQDEVGDSAGNLTIITKEGQVTIRGAVDSEAEKEAVERIAKSKAGENEVNLEVTVATR